MKNLVVLFSLLFLSSSFSQTQEIIYPKFPVINNPIDTTYSQIIWLGTDYSSFDYEYLFNHWYQPNYDIHLTAPDGLPLLFTDINTDNTLDMIGNSEISDTLVIGYAEYDSNAVPIFQFVNNFQMDNYWPSNVIDLDNDGVDEILIASQYPYVNVFNNDLTFKRSLPVRNYLGTTPALTANLNGNDKIDFVIEQLFNNNFSINFYEYDYLNDSINIITRIDSIMRKLVVNGDTVDTLVKIYDDSFSKFVEGDLDGDGLPEIAAGHVQGHLCIFEYDGVGYKQVYFDRMPTYNMYQIAITNDINLNGKNELIVMGNYDGGPIYWLEADGNNSYSVIRKDFINYGGVISILMMTMYDQDVDLDGKDELVFRGGSLIWILKFNPVESKWDMLAYFNVNHDYDAMWGNGHNRSFPGHISNITFYDIDNDDDNDMFVSTDEDITLFFESNLSILDVQEQPILFPDYYLLLQNYPNPFNPITTINYSVPKTSNVSLIVYDVLGREIKTLVNSEKLPGNYSVQFDGSDLSSGVYLYVMRADNPSTNSGQGFINTKKLILIK
jgi:hypothetical protein